MRRYLIIVFLLFALGSVWLFSHVPRERNVNLPNESGTDNRKLMGGIVSTISEGDKDKCIGSPLLSTFQQILYEEKSSEIDSCIILFHAEAFLSDDVLQNELQARLKNLYPNEMKTALKSSGNIHNPKLFFLYSALRPAIRDTPSMQKLSKIAQSYGYEAAIHSLGGEKLHFRRKDSKGTMFTKPQQRLYGFFGFSARKPGWEDKPNLKARIVDVDEKGNVWADEIKIIGKTHYW